MFLFLSWRHEFYLVHFLLMKCVVYFVHIYRQHVVVCPNKLRLLWHVLSHVCVCVCVRAVRQREREKESKSEREKVEGGGGGGGGREGGRNTGKNETQKEKRQTETSQVKALFVSVRPVAHYNEGWEEEEKMSNAEKSYTVRTDTETESEIWMYRRLFAFCNYSSFT